MIAIDQLVCPQVALSLLLGVIAFVAMFRHRLAEWKHRLIVFFSDPKKAAVAIVIGFPYSIFIPFINFPGRDYLVASFAKWYSGSEESDFGHLNATVQSVM
uniref:7TM_GPCR_Srx domain-containing protein n=1 Tax=Steinernema glaseri TaxID=37863 RepID=A0A1I7ZDD2_9BILA